MKTMNKVEFRKTILATISVLALFFFGVYQVVWAPAEDITYSPGTVKGSFTIEGVLAVTESGLPVIITNDTDTSVLELLRLYHARGPGNGIDGDTMIINFQFDDNATTSIPVRLVVEGTDLDPKGGTWGRIRFQAGQGPPPDDIFIVDGVNDNVQANFYGLITDIDTGMKGGVDLIQWAISNITHLSLVGGGTNELQLGVGYNLVVNNSGSFGDKLAVGVTVGAMDASVRFQVGGTTLGSLPAPRMTTAQRKAIASGTPTDGAQADDSDLNALFRYNGPKAAWERVAVDIPTVKSGTVAGASFAGNPKIFTVTFNTAFPDANYAVTINGEDNRTWTFQSKLAASFTINANANLALVGDVDWTATAHFDP